MGNGHNEKVCADFMPMVRVGKRRKAQTNFITSPKVRLTAVLG